MKNVRPVYVVGSARIPFAKSFTAYKNVTRKDLMVASLNPLINKFGLEGKLIGDVALGAVMNSASDWNLAREAVLDTFLHPHTPAYSVQRACGTSLETAWQLSMKIALGQMDVAIAGGVDTNSDLPVEVSERFRHAVLEASQAKSAWDGIKPFLGLRPKDLKPRAGGVVEPRTLMSMGDHTELMVKEWGISREDQDVLAMASHKNGAAAYDRGFYNDMVHAFMGHNRDLTLRGDTSIEKLAKLRPAFDKKMGSLTAGNSSPLTDGSSAVLLASEQGMKAHHWQPLARVVDFEVAAVDFVKGEGLLMAPTIAVSRMLERNKLSLQDFGFYEIHEAFAGQVLCTLKAWESEEYCKRVLGRSAPMGKIPREKMNVVGSSLALGHPFAATGGRIVGTLAKLISQSPNPTRGLISICTAGGMGVTAILESV